MKTLLALKYSPVLVTGMSFSTFILSFLVVSLGQTSRLTD